MIARQVRRRLRLFLLLGGLLTCAMAMAWLLLGQPTYDFVFTRFAGIGEAPQLWEAQLSGSPPALRARHARCLQSMWQEGTLTYSPDGRSVASVVFLAIRPPRYQVNLVTASEGKARGAVGVIADREARGRAEALAGSIAYHPWPAWDHEGRRFVVSLPHDGRWQVCIVEAKSLRYRWLSTASDTLWPSWLTSETLVCSVAIGNGLQLATLALSGGPPAVLTAVSGVCTHPQLSPHGDRIAFRVRSSEGVAVWVYDLATKESQPVYGPTGDCCGLNWSPSGSELVFYASRCGEEGSRRMWEWDIVLVRLRGGRHGSKILLRGYYDRNSQPPEDAEYSDPFFGLRPILWWPDGSAVLAVVSSAMPPQLWCLLPSGLAAPVLGCPDWVYSLGHPLPPASTVDRLRQWRLRGLRVR